MRTPPARPRCYSCGRPTGGAFQRSLLSHSGRDTTVTLPPLLISRPTHFSLQLLDLAHRGSDREDNDIHIFGVLPWLPQSTSLRPLRVLSKLLAHRPICQRQSQDSLPDASRTTHRPCTQGGQLSKWILSNVASWKSSRQQHGSMSSSSPFPSGANSNSSSQDARSFRASRKLQLAAHSSSIRTTSLPNESTEATLTVPDYGGPGGKKQRPACSRCARYC